MYSGPYHSVRGSFVYHDVKQPDKYKVRLGIVYECSDTYVRWIIDIMCTINSKNVRVESKQEKSACSKMGGL